MGVTLTIAPTDGRWVLRGWDCADDGSAQMGADGRPSAPLGAHLRSDQCLLIALLLVVVVLHPFLWRRHAIKRWGREKIQESLMQDSFGYDIEGG